MALSRGSKGFLIVLVVLVAGAFGGLRLLGGDEEGLIEGEPVTVVIPEGVGAGEVADILADEGVIGSPLAFRIRSQMDDRAGQIRPGTYDIVPGTSAQDILEQLSATPDAAPAFTVTIPEGLTVAETLQRIADAEGSPFTVEELTAALDAVALPEWVPVAEIPAEQPFQGLTPYEGLLFPNTYEFRVDAPAAEVLQRLIDETSAVLDEVGTPPDLSRYQVLVMASLVEREARLAEEQATIASVMHNRLAAPMRLQIDATVLYAKADPGAGRVLNADLENPSPWNTYTNDGLPPTPISGAGEGAIRAAAQPAATDFAYYVVNSCEGSHAFAATNDEHNQNVAAFRALDCSSEAPATEPPDSSG